MKDVADKFIHYAHEAIDHADSRAELQPFGPDGGEAASTDPLKARALESSGLTRLDKIVDAAGLDTKLGGSAPAYWHAEDDDGNIVADGLQFPRASRFRNPAVRRSVLLHELSHWAAAKVSQPAVGLNDADSVMFHLTGKAPEAYNIEEMTAELAAVLVQSALEEIPDELVPGIGSYIGGYLAQISPARRAEAETKAIHNAKVRAEFLLSLA